MSKIGILYGMENSFPTALVERINEKKQFGLQAEAIRLGGVEIAQVSGYDVIIDRVSQDIEFYRAFLKNAALSGTVVLNDPFVAGAHDRFYHYAVAKKEGLSVPNTVLIPQKSHPPGTTGQSMRNLEFPLNWDKVFRHVGFPAFLKPLGRGGWLGTHRVESPEHFFSAYDQTDSVCMFLQSTIPLDEQYRCFVVGQEHTRVLKYDANKPVHLRHTTGADDTPRHICDAMQDGALRLCRRLGYDINAVDFAVHDGQAYVIDSFNMAPEADARSLGQANFDWFVDQVAQLAIKRTQKREGSGSQQPAGKLEKQMAAGLQTSAL